MDFHSSLSDIVVAFAKPVLAISKIQQRCVFAFHPLEQRRLRPARRELLDLFHVVFRPLQSLLEAVNRVQHVFDILPHACQQRARADHP